MVDRRKPYNHLLPRTLRARGNGAADRHPLIARREAPPNHADQPDIARPKLRFVRARRLSAAPLAPLPASANFLKG